MTDTRIPPIAPADADRDVTHMVITTDVSVLAGDGRADLFTATLVRRPSGEVVMQVSMVPVMIWDRTTALMVADKIRRAFETNPTHVD